MSLCCAGLLDRASSSSPHDAGVGRGPRRGESSHNFPPLPGIHPMEEREFLGSLLSALAFHEPSEAPPGFGVRQTCGSLAMESSRPKAPEDSRTPRRCRAIRRFRVPMRAQKANGRLSINRPTPDPSQEGSRCSSASFRFPSWEGLGVGSWSQCMQKDEWALYQSLRAAESG
jgi:hypothetical protein